MSARKLINDHLDLWTGAVTTRSTAGRGRNGKIELTGIKKLRELILELAVRGKLVEQDPSDEPASVLLERIAEEKARLVKEGKIKKPKTLPEIAEEEKPFELPDGWTWTRLGNITSKIGSGATPRGGKNAYTETGIPFLRSQNIWNDGLSLEDVAYIPENTHEKMSNTHVSPNDILLNITGASLGRCTVVPDSLSEANVSQHVTIIRTTESANRTYLHATMLSPYIQGLVWGRQVGMAREGLSKKVLELFEIPIPPEVEQHRIVEKADELMALCDRLEQQVGDQLEAHEVLVDTLLDALTRSADAAEVAENWTRIAEHFDTLFTSEASIDKLKQTILQLAVMGRLVEQDLDDEPASVLLERIAEEKARLVKEGKIKKPKKLPEVDEGETHFPIPSSWALTRLGEIVEIVRGITFPASEKSSTPEDGRIACLRTSNVQERIEWDDILYIRDSFVSKSSQYVRMHDIVMSMANSRELVGKVAIIEKEPSEPTAFGGFLGVIRPIFLHPRFLMAVLRAPHARTALIGGASQTTNIANISIGKLNPFVIGIPPLEEQHRIVENVDELMALCDQLKTRLGKASETRTHLAEAVVEQAVS